MGARPVGEILSESAANPEYVESEFERFARYAGISRQGDYSADEIDHIRELFFAGAYGLFRILTDVEGQSETDVDVQWSHIRDELEAFARRIVEARERLEPQTNGSTAEIRLGPKEQILFDTLARSPERRATSAQLIKAAWGSEPTSNPSSCLQAYISKMRKRLSPRYEIATLRGFGYQLVETGRRV